MVTTVTLRDPFEYYTWVIVLAVLFLIMAIVLAFFSVKRIYAQRVASAPKDVPRIVRPAPRQLQVIKIDYEKRLSDLSAGYSNKTIGRREAYQRLSSTIRGFVAEVTGIDVERYTKTEIATFGIKSLDKLMDEYYVPEFAEDEKGVSKNFVVSCNNALGVVRKWN